MLQIGEGSRRVLGEVLGLANNAISLYSLAGRAGLDTDTLLYPTVLALMFVPMHRGVFLWLFIDFHNYRHILHNS